MITCRDDVTGEVMDQFGNWYDNIVDYEDAMNNLADKKYEELKDEIR